MPVPVRLLGSNGEQLNLVLNHTTNNQIFIENVPFTVTSMLFDPQKHLISKNNLVTLDVTQVQTNALLRLYPNPTSSILNLQYPTDLKLEKAVFYNTLGQTILTSTETTWDVSDFANGVYFLKVFNANGIQTFTFIKK